MPSVSRIGNSLFFIGLILAAFAVFVFAESEPVAWIIVLPIGAVALALTVLGGWLWNKPDPDHQPMALSRVPAKFKMLFVIPGALLIFASAGQSGNEVQSFMGAALLGAAIVGVIELLVDRNYPTAKERWDHLSAWRKIVISTVVIVAAIALCFAVMPLVATLIYE